MTENLEQKYNNLVRSAWATGDEELMREATKIRYDIEAIRGELIQGIFLRTNELPIDSEEDCDMRPVPRGHYLNPDNWRVERE